MSVNINFHIYDHIYDTSVLPLTSLFIFTFLNQLFPFLKYRNICSFHFFEISHTSQLILYRCNSLSLSKFTSLNKFKLILFKIVAHLFFVWLKAASNFDNFAKFANLPTITSSLLWWFLIVSNPFSIIESFIVNLYHYSSWCSTHEISISFWLNILLN